MIKGISVLAVPPGLRGVIGDRRAAGRRRPVAREVRMPAGVAGYGPGPLRTLSVRTPDLWEGGLSVLSDGARRGFDLGR